MKKILPILVVLAIVVAVFVYLSGRTGKLVVKAQTINVAYDHVPKGLKDWTISLNAKNAIVSSLSCAPLQGTGAYLPVDRDRPMRCGVVRSSAGVVSAYVIGIGRPDNGTAYPQSMLVTLHASGATITTKIVPFPLIEKDANAKVDAFVKIHPKAVIWPPDDNAKKLYSEVEAVVTEAIRAPSIEVRTGMETLRAMAEGMTN